MKNMLKKRKIIGLITLSVVITIIILINFQCFPKFNNVTTFYHRSDVKCRGNEVAKSI